MNPNDFVTDEAKAAEQLDDQIFHASGARGQAGMAPYPLYGIQGLGTETEVAVPFYRRPWFCYSVGGVVGFGASYAFFTWAWPFIQKHRKKMARNKAKASKE